MNVKRYFAASLAVFAAALALDFTIHGMILAPAYAATKAVWRPDMESMVWLFWLISLIVAFPFTYIFVKGYEGKGIMEGVRFGLIIGLYVTIPMAWGMYGMLPVPHSLAIQWFVWGMIEMIVLGIVAAAVYRPKKP